MSAATWTELQFTSSSPPPPSKDRSIPQQQQQLSPLSHQNLCLFNSLLRPPSFPARSMYGTMEPTRCWMWTRRKIGGSSHIPPLSTMAPANYNDSTWEEQAFADDSDGRFGGCVWPPRSYSCSFCGREFRSAQALGGHMNVHRRDRARLKQSPPEASSLVESSSSNIIPHHHQQFNCYPIPCSTQSVQNPPQTCTLLYGSNPNHAVLASPLQSPPEVPLLSSTPEKSCTRKNTLISISPCTLSADHIQGQRKRSFFSMQSSPDLELQQNNLGLREIGCCDRINGGDDDLGEEITSCNGKRRRTHAALSFLKDVASDDGARFQPEVLVLGHNPIEELDLELRLGNRPKNE